MTTCVGRIIGSLAGIDGVKKALPVTLLIEFGLGVILWYGGLLGGVIILAMFVGTIFFFFEDGLVIIRELLEDGVELLRELLVTGIVLFIGLGVGWWCLQFTCIHNICVHCVFLFHLHFIEAGLVGQAGG